MDENEEKQVYFEELASVRAKRDKLPGDSLVREALSDEVLQLVYQKILEAAPDQLLYDFWPLLYGFFCLKSDEDIAALDADLMHVVQYVTPGNVSGITQFLNTKDRARQGDWYGGLFDLWTKATASRTGKQFAFDGLLPNGRNSDVCLEMNGRRFHIESTVLTRDDESAEVWKRYLEDKRVDPSRVLIRPGPYCPPNAKGPSVYYVTLRFYAKVFDKLAKNLDPSKSQFADDEPNVLLVSFSGSEVRSDYPGVGWGLDELFSAQPRTGRIVVPESFTDISLGAWIDFRAKELISQSKMTPAWFCDHSHQIIAAPRRLGAVMLYDGCRLRRSRVNYNAEHCCAVSHSEIAQLEELFNNEVSYWS